MDAGCRAIEELDQVLPSEFGKWNSVWKRFWRLSRSGVFEAFFQMLAECSQTAIKPAVTSVMKNNPG